MSLFGENLATAPPADGLDVHDVGVVQLPRLIEWERDLEPLVVPFAAIPKRPLVVPALHAMTGFPANKAKVDRIGGYVDTEQIGLVEVSVSADRYPELGLSILEHIALPFNHKRLHNFTNGRRHFPSPAGMSGSPIWSLESHRGVLLHILRGVFTRHLSNDRVLVGCRMKHVLTMIEQLEAKPGRWTGTPLPRAIPGVRE